MYPTATTPPTERISSSAFFMLICAGLFVDIIKFILTFLGIGIIADTGVDIFAWLIILLWFKMKGFSLFEDSRALFAAIAAGTVGAIPVIDGLLPATTAGVWRIARVVQKIDREKMDQAPQVKVPTRPEIIAAQRASQARPVLEVDTPTNDDETTAEDVGQGQDDEVAPPREKLYSNYDTPKKAA